MSDYQKWQSMSREELIEELSFVSMALDEGDEILSELARSVAGLAGELLTPCTDGCAGHFRDASQQLFLRGLKRYEELYTDAGPEETKPIPGPVKRKVFYSQ